MNSNGVVDDIISCVLDILEVGSIIKDCKNIIAEPESVGFSVRFDRRHANEIAHVLARASRFHTSPSSWLVFSMFIIENGKI